MPHSKVHQMANRTLDATQSKITNCPADLAFIPEDEFVELLWENGQLVMQGQSSRTRRGTLPSALSSPRHSVMAQEKDNGDAKKRTYGVLDPVVNGFSSSGPPAHVGMAQNDGMVPWLNYMTDDPLQNDYCSEFFTELSGSNLNLLSALDNTVPVEKTGRYDQVVRDLHTFSVQGNPNLERANSSKAAGRDSDPARIRRSPLSLSSRERLTSVPNPRSRVSAYTALDDNNGHQVHCRNSSQSPVMAPGMLNSRFSMEDPSSTRPLQPRNSTGLMNFSHFSRPAALVKANLQSTGIATAGSLGADRLRSSDKVHVTSNPTELSVVESSNGVEATAREQSGSIPTRVDLKKSPGKTPQEAATEEKLEGIYQEDASRNNRSPDHLHQSSSVAASVALGRPEREKAFRPAVATSSACSGKSAGAASNDTTHDLKRKGHEGDDSGYQSEDGEDESMDVKKPAKCPKRSRAAEVHNLSERRRRDKINEKMRALQELIPNCNKVDKASMLDEAIEYLKTLQLQVQIMSMGSGLWPPMMLPAAMQNIRPPPMAHFPPMGLGMGMGMGMGFGMSMLDMGCSSSYPLIPVPPITWPQFPGPSISGPSSLHGMPGLSLPLFGIPGQVPFSLPRAPFIPLSGFATKSIPVPDPPGEGCPVPLRDSALPSSSKDQIQGISPQIMAKTSADCLQIQTSDQATKQSFEQCDLMQKKQILQLGGDGSISTNRGNEIASNRTTGFD